MWMSLPLPQPPGIGGTYWTRCGSVRILLRVSRNSRLDATARSVIALRDGPGERIMGLAAMDQGDPPAPTITLVLADDHNVMRSGLRMLLDAESDFEVVAESRDVLSAFQAVRGHRPDVLVLDLNMPGGSSIEAIRRLGPISPKTSVVVLTMEQDRAFVRDALDAGAKGYVQKQAAGRELVRAIRAAAAGRA